MVLESLIGPKKAERRPWETFFLGMVYATIGLFLALWIFREQASMIMVFLTVIACIPLMYKTLKFEEKKDMRIIGELKLLREHGKALAFFMFLFLGFLAAYVLWYVLLPEPTVKTLFSAQTKTIMSINSQFAPTGNAIKSGLIMQIFSNNMKVLLLAVFFSFFYGAGAIFILTWNASVIATAAGTFIRENIQNAFGLAYFHIISIGIFKYMTHGIFEIIAYFIGGLAGGIISVAVIRHEVNTKKFKKVLTDSIDLVIIAFLLLIVAALIEVYVTPKLF